MEINKQLNHNTVRRILIANRGEIVSRILKTCRRLGIETVVIYSSDDAQRPYVSEADIAVPLPGTSLDETYLNQTRIIEIALETKADAIHPGYGFLSENAAFAQKCIDQGLVWIGPSPAIMRRMADKTQARSLAENIDIPVIPAYTSSKHDPLLTLTEQDFPILLKAAAGGGGRGMRVVRKAENLKEQVQQAADEARLAFGDDRLFIEKYIEQAKHIEVQILGDKHGNYIHLYERECTIQRRYQKIIEESPAPSISQKIRLKLTQAAIELAKASKYDNAGTVEFLVTPDEEYYFIETNARIQVEHPVTEMITGIDLIEYQIRIASGEKLDLNQEAIRIKGHALECRICAESPQNNFAPYPGVIQKYLLPEGPGIRIDTALFAGNEVSALYDSLIAKLIVHAPDRTGCLNQAVDQLKKSAFMGIETNIPYLMEILRHSDFTSGKFFTSFIAIHHQNLIKSLEKKRANGYTDLVLSAFAWLQTTGKNPHEPTGNPWKDLGYWRALSELKVEIEDQLYAFELEKPNSQQIAIKTQTGRSSYLFDCQEQQHLIARKGKKVYEILWVKDHDIISMSVEGNLFRLTNPLTRPNNQDSGKYNSGMQVIKAPLPGKLARINLAVGDVVKEGQTLAIIESMKVENQILATTGGKIKSIEVHQGEQIKMKQVLLIIEP